MSVAVVQSYGLRADLASNEQDVINFNFRLPWTPAAGNMLLLVINTDYMGTQDSWDVQSAGDSWTDIFEASNDRLIAWWRPVDMGDVGNITIVVDEWSTGIPVERERCSIIVYEISGADMSGPIDYSQEKSEATGSGGITVTAGSATTAAGMAFTFAGGGWTLPVDTVACSGFTQGAFAGAGQARSYQTLGRFFSAYKATILSESVVSTWTWSPNSSAGSLSEVGANILIKEGSALTGPFTGEITEPIQTESVVLPGVTLANEADIVAESSLATLIEFSWGRAGDLSSKTMPHVRGYTNWTSNLNVSGNFYASLSAIDIKDKLVLSGGAQNKPLKMRLPISAQPMNLLGRAFPISDVRVRIMEVDPFRPGDSFKELFIGEISKVTRSSYGRSGVVTIEVASFKKRLEIPLGIIADTRCTHIFGGKNCCVPVGGITDLDARSSLLLVNDNHAEHSTLGVNADLDNVTLLDGEGEIFRKQSVLQYTSGHQLRDVAISPVNGAYVAVGHSHHAPKQYWITAWTAEGVPLFRRDSYDIASGSGTDYIDAYSCLWSRDGLGVLVGCQVADKKSSNQNDLQPALFKLDHLGESLWRATPGVMTRTLSIAETTDENVVVTGIHDDTSASADVAHKIDVSDGSTLLTYEDAQVTDDPSQWNAIAVGSNRVVVVGRNVTSSGTFSVWVFNETTGALVNRYDTGTTPYGVACFNGKAYVVGDDNAGDNLWVFTLSTGSLDTTYSLESGVDLKDIKVDELGIAFVAGDSANGRVHVYDFTATVDDDIDHYEDSLGSFGDPVRMAIVPRVFGKKVLRGIHSVDEDIVRLLEDLPDPNSTGTRFRDGYIERDGIAIKIRDQISDKVLRLARPIPPEWMAGSTVVCVPGCNGQIDTCRTEWDNESQFTAPGYAIPNYNPMYEGG